MNKKKIIIIISVLVLLIACFFVFLLINNKKNLTYNVIFNTNGGSKINEQIVNKGETIVKPNDPIKEGYIFVCWMYEGKIFDFNSAMDSNIILEAKWEKVNEDKGTYVVKFDTNGGTTIPNQIIEKGNKVVKPTTPTKKGYLFKGWNLNKQEYNFDMAVTNNLELVAVWEKLKVDITSSDKSHNTTTTVVKNEQNLPKPQIKIVGVGGNEEEWTNVLAFDSVEGITGVEVYVSTEENGTYKLSETILKKDFIDKLYIEVKALTGQHLYFKVKTYKENEVGKFYSDYSNVIEIDNTN